MADHTDDPTSAERASAEVVRFPFRRGAYLRSLKTRDLCDELMDGILELAARASGRADREPLTEDELRQAGEMGQYARAMLTVWSVKPQYPAVAAYLMQLDQAALKDVFQLFSTSVNILRGRARPVTPGTAPDA